MAKTKQFVNYPRGEVIPCGRFEGRKLSELSWRYLCMLHGSWNASERLSRTEFFQSVCEEKSRRTREWGVGSEVGRFTLGEDGKCLVGTIYGDRVEIRRSGDDYVATRII